jgi:hypothetical protein
VNDNPDFDPLPMALEVQDAADRLIERAVRLNHMIMDRREVAYSGDAILDSLNSPRGLQIHIAPPISHAAIRVCPE